MTPECDYPKVKWLLERGTKLISAVQDTFEGRTYRGLSGAVRPGDVHSAEILFHRCLQSATAENNMAISNHRVVEAVHPNTVRAVFRRAGTTMKKRLLPGRWYRVIED